ncbi:TPA_asm: polyprotein [Frullania virus 1]|uniref:Replicase n=1 Tax=Frullania virus 1 TaxID=2977968 RepID=A0A9N6YIW5_9RHAB|nr:TPA_asm: polyprotein [Frullania virus 1]
MDLADYFLDLDYSEEYHYDERPLKDLHLNNAINLDELEYILNPTAIKYNLLPSGYLQKDWDDAIRLGILDGNGLIGTTNVLLSSMKRTYNLSPLNTETASLISGILRRALKKRDINIPITCRDDLSIPESIQVPSEWIRPFDLVMKAVCDVSEAARGGTRSIDSSVRRNGKFTCWGLTSGGQRYEFFLSQNIFIVKTCGREYYGNYDCALLYLDILGQRICAYLSLDVCSKYETPGCLEKLELFELLEIGDKILDIMGNEGYNLIGMFEALVVSTILKKNPDGINPESMFYESCIAEVDEIIRDSSGRESLYPEIRRMLSLLERMEPYKLSNVFCLYRIWGHPRVNIKEGMDKIFKLGKKQKVIPTTISNAVLLQFRKMFLMSFYQREHYYPPCETSGNSYISAQIRNNLPISERDPGYSFSDFERVTLKKCWSVPPTYDMCHILNDKAVSPTRSELIYNIQQGKGTRCGNLRRGILRWMEGDSIRCEEFLQDIEIGGLSENDLIIGMYEKERELKVAARMFSLMSENMRYYFVLTEELIANHILPYFPEITMKDSLNVLLKKLWNLGGRRSRGQLHTNVNIDFSKWNTNMREDLTKGLFTEMDRLFGYENVISRTHEIFEESFIYSASGKFCPFVIDGELVESPPMSYTGHLGGFEGLRQKGWTVLTVVILIYISEKLGLHANLMGQGDNQIIRIYMPVGKWNSRLLTEEQQKEEARMLVEMFIKEMDIQYGMAQMPIKVRETWKSTRLFMYGKVMLLNGEQLPQWYKKILRSYALSNEGSLTISGVIGTIATNMMSAASVSIHPDVMYTLFLVLGEWSLRYLLKYHPFTRKSIMSDTQRFVKVPSVRGWSNEKIPSINISVLISMLLIVPTSIGGSITIPMTSFIFRGFPDKASEGYAWVKMLGSVQSPLKVYLKNWFSFLSNGTIEPDMLIQSPWSLNHKKPPTPGMNSRDDIRSWILSGTFKKNRFLNNLKPLLDIFERKQICQNLMTDPMNPLISHEVYETFPQTYLDGICRRVENTRTIKKLNLARVDRKPIVSKMMDAEHNHILYVWWRSLRKGEEYSSCATEQARISRNVGWGRTINGITTPHPLELIQGNICPGDRSNCKETDYIYVKVDTKGDFAPYLGSKIKVKVSSSQDSEARNEPLIKCGSRVARYMNWIGMGDNMRKLVNDNVAMVCDVNIYDTFIDDDPQGNLYTGALEHRFNPASASEGCFINYSPQVGHSVFLSSDNMPKYGRGQTNYTLHFQALYCFLQYISVHNPCVSYYHYHISCDSCVVPTSNEIPDMPEIGPSIKLAQADKSVKMIRDTLGYIHEKIPMPLSQEKQNFVCVYRDLESFGEKQIRNGLTETLAFLCAKELTFFRGMSGSQIGSEDLQTYPRIYSYKLSRHLLLYLTARWMILIQVMHSGIAPDGTNLNKLRRRVQDILVTSRADTFKSLGSLCLNRTGNFEKVRGVNIVEGTSYPETVQTYLEGLRATLISTVATIGKITMSASSLTPLPRDSVTPLDVMMIASSKSVLNSGCLYLSKKCEEWRRTNTLPKYKACSHDCTRWALSGTPVMLCSMDKAFKQISSIGDNKTERRPDKSEIRSSSVFQIHNERVVSSPEMRHIQRTNVAENVFERGRLITLPTSSVYKWDDVLCNFDIKGSAVVLGDGTGGTSLVASAYVKGTVYPTALLETKALIPQDLQSLRPALSRSVQNVSDTFCLSVPDNIMSEGWKECVLRELSNISSSVMFIIDIEAEGGNMKHVKRVIECLPEETEVLSKLYYPELMRDPSFLMSVKDLVFICTPLANLKYGEMFMKFTISKGIRSPSINQIMICWDKFVLDLVRLQERDIKTRINDIEYRYFKLAMLSKNISLNHWQNLGVLLSEEHLKLSGEELLSYVYQYINTHYRFAGKTTGTRTGKVVSPERKLKLIRVLKMTIASVCGEDIMLDESFQKLDIFNLSQGLIGKPYYSISIMPSSSVQTALIGKDCQAVRCITNYRSRIHIPEISSEGGIGVAFRSGILGNMSTKSYSASIASSSSEDSLRID